MKRYLLQFLVALVILGGAAYGTKKLIDSRVPAPRHAPVVLVPNVRALRVQRQDVRLDVHTHGTVAPRTDTTLVAEVSGKVDAVSPALVAGGFFAAGDELVTIATREYELAVTAADADVAQRRTALLIERAEAEVAIAQWKELGKGEAPPLARREPQVAQAEAALAAADARLQRAQLDRERCHVRAPYAGRVWQKRTDVGQYVTAGTPLARVYAVDYAEVRLPIAAGELAFLDLPLDYHGEARDDQPQPGVTFRATLAGAEHTWPGRIVRTEGEIDPRSRMVHAVARVEAPYAPGPNGAAARPPLAVGMFVSAEITGRTFPGIAVLPRSAVRPGGREVLVIDPDDTLRRRAIEVLRATREQVYVRSGLADGDRVCLTPLEVFADGMPVKVVDPEAPAQKDPAQKATAEKQR